MRNKLIWSGILVAALTALLLVNCRRFPSPGEPIAPKSSAAIAAPVSHEARSTPTASHKLRRLAHGAAAAPAT